MVWKVMFKKITGRGKVFAEIYFWRDLPMALNIFASITN